MQTSEPAWALLPGDIWRRVMLCARGDLRPVSAGSVGHSSHTCLDWVAWWKLVARTGGTCMTVRAALLGPDSGALWKFIFLQSPDSSYPVTGQTRSQLKGILKLLVFQGHHARSAHVIGSRWQPSLLLSAVESLGSVHDLSLFWFSSDLSAGCVTAALRGQLSSLYFVGECAIPCSRSLLQLQRLQMALQQPPEAELRRLAGWLPRLQHLQLHLNGSYPDEAVCDLQLLKLLPAGDIELHLTCGGAYRDSTSCCGHRLQQLAGVKLHTLFLLLHSETWTAEQALLLAGCQVSAFVFISADGTGPTARLARHLPSGAAVVHLSVPDV